MQNRVHQRKRKTPKPKVGQEWEQSVEQSENKNHKVGQEWKQSGEN